MPSNSKKKVSRGNHLDSLRKRLAYREEARQKTLKRMMEDIYNEENVRFIKRREYLERLGEILKLRREHRKTLESIADLYGLSRERVRQILRDYDEVLVDPPLSASKEAKKKIK